MALARLPRSAVFLELGDRRDLLFRVDKMFIRTNPLHAVRMFTRQRLR